MTLKVLYFRRYDPCPRLGWNKVWDVAIRFPQPDHRKIKIRTSSHYMYGSLTKFEFWYSMVRLRKTNCSCPDWVWTRIFIFDFSNIKIVKFTLLYGTGYSEWEKTFYRQVLKLYIYIFFYNVSSNRGTYIGRWSPFWRVEVYYLFLPPSYLSSLQ